MKPFASFANLCAFAGARAALRFLALLLLAASACFVVDATDWALPLEAWLAERMASALRCVFVGVGADPALMGTVAPSCAGVRTAIGAAILGACLAERRKLLGALVGAACGLGLNFVRLVAIEAVLRVDHAAGMMLHDLALYAVVLPAALLAAWLWRAASRPARLTLAGCALYLGALLLAVDIPDPREEITEAHRGLHRGAQSIAWTELPQAANVDLTGFYLDLTRRPAGALCSRGRFAPSALHAPWPWKVCPFGPARSVLCSPSGEAASLSRPGAGIHTGAPAVSRPRIHGSDTPAPRVRDPGTPAPGQTL